MKLTHLFVAPEIIFVSISPVKLLHRGNRHKTDFWRDKQMRSFYAGATTIVILTTEAKNIN